MPARQAGRAKRKPEWRQGSFSHLAAYLRSFTGQEPDEANVAHFMRFIAAR